MIYTWLLGRAQEREHLRGVHFYWYLHFKIIHVQILSAKAVCWCQMILKIYLRNASFVPPFLRKSFAQTEVGHGAIKSQVTEEKQLQQTEVGHGAIKSQVTEEKHLHKPRLVMVQ